LIEGGGRALALGLVGVQVCSYLRRQPWRQRRQSSAPWRSREQPSTLAHPAWAGYPLRL